MRADSRKLLDVEKKRGKTKNGIFFIIIVCLTKSFGIVISSFIMMMTRGENVD